MHYNPRAQTYAARPATSRGHVAPFPVREDLRPGRDVVRSAAAEDVSIQSQASNPMQQLAYHHASIMTVATHDNARWLTQRACTLQASFAKEHWSRNAMLHITHVCAHIHPYLRTHNTLISGQPCKRVPSSSRTSSSKN